MDNELMLDVQKIIVTKGNIEFNEYEKVKEQALKLASNIETVEVNEDNIKESKKLLAAVNKRLKELEDKRISIKKEMLEPYQLFEDQVKEIVTIVKNADSEVRKQVKYLEEFERLEKELVVEELFNKRKKQYSALDALIQFENFLQPKHLNKSTSIQSIEKEVVEFLEKISAEYEAIKLMPNADDVLSAYIGCFDLPKALSHVNEQNQLKRQIDKLITPKKSTAPTKTFVMVVYDEKDLKLITLFAEQNEIKFDIKDGF